MRFAVVGDSPCARGFLRAVAESPDHELAAFVFAPRLYAELASLAPAARVCPSWEELLSDLEFSAVIVAGEDERSLTAARQLAASGKTLYAAATVGRATSFVYELTLLQAEQDVRLVPLMGLRAHPLTARLRDILAAGRIGDIRHIQLEHRIVPAESADTPSGCLAIADIAAGFLPDADLLRSIWGEYTQVTTVRSGDAATGISMETTTLAGAHVPQVVWSTTPATEKCQWRLCAVGQLGTATLSGSPDNGAFRLEVSVSNAPPELVDMTFDQFDWLLRTSPGGRPSSPAEPHIAGEPSAIQALCPNWDDFTRAAELLEAAERSVRRRRMIEIHFETPSERGQFKTQMTAVGCSLLMFTLFAIVAYLTATSLIDMNVRVKQVLVVLIFLPLGIFLALQGLLVLARPSAPPGSEKRAKD